MNVVKFRERSVIVPTEPPVIEAEATSSTIEVNATIITPETEKKDPTDSPIQLFLRFLKFLYTTSRSILFATWIAFRTCLRYVSRHPVHATLNCIMVVVLALVVFTGSEIHNQMILGKISDHTIDTIVEGSRFPRGFDSEEVAQNGVREFLQVGAPAWMQREGVRAILFYSRKAGLSIEDQAVLLAIADIESGFNPMARAPTTTACGLFQFVKRTGEMFSLPSAACMDPWANAKAAVDHFNYNYERRVQKQVINLAGAEKVFRTFELSYYLHHDGPDSHNPSNDVKATILSGTQFLFKAYHALIDESESQQRAPTFTESFYKNFLNVLDIIRENFSATTAPFFGRVVQGGEAIPNEHLS